jgi:hypothetical protein
MIIQVTQGPPDTTTYYHIAYTWAAILYSGYALFLWSRARRIRARLRDAARPGTRPRRDA